MAWFNLLCKWMPVFLHGRLWSWASFLACRRKCFLVHFFTGLPGTYERMANGRLISFIEMSRWNTCGLNFEGSLLMLAISFLSLVLESLSSPIRMTNLCLWFMVARRDWWCSPMPRFVVVIEVIGSFTPNFSFLMIFLIAVGFILANRMA